MYDLIRVPQRSLLGPLLFLLYKFSFFSLLYADTNLKSREKTVNSELLKVSDWLNANKLMLSAKRQTMLPFVIST